MSQHEKGRHCLYYYSLCDNTLLTVGITTAIDVSGANEVFSTDPDPVLSLTLPPNTELKPIFILGVFMYMSTSKQASVKAKLKLKVPLTTYVYVPPPDGSAHPAIGQEYEHQLLPGIIDAPAGDVPRARKPLPVRSAVCRPNLSLQVLQAPTRVQNSLLYSSSRSTTAQ